MSPPCPLLCWPLIAVCNPLMGLLHDLLIHNHTILVGLQFKRENLRSDHLHFVKQFSSGRGIRCPPPPGMSMPSDGLPPFLPSLLMTSLLYISANTLCLYMQSFNAVGSHLDLVCYWPLASKWPALILFDNLYAPPTSTNHHLPMLHCSQ